MSVLPHLNRHESEGSKVSFASSILTPWNDKENVLGYDERERKY